MSARVYALVVIVLGAQSLAHMQQKKAPRPARLLTLTAPSCDLVLVKP
jgi:hypothetical protein